MQQVLDAAQVLRRRGASIGRRVGGAAPAREGRRTIDAPCAQLAKMTRSSVRATARNVTFPRGASAMGCGAHQAMARGASGLMRRTDCTVTASIHCCGREHASSPWQRSSRAVEASSDDVARLVLDARCECGAPGPRPPGGVTPQRRVPAFKFGRPAASAGGRFVCASGAHSVAPATCPFPFRAPETRTSPASSSKTSSSPTALPKTTPRRAKPPAARVEHLS